VELFKLLGGWVIGDLQRMPKSPFAVVPGPLTSFRQAAGSSTVPTGYWI